MDIPDSDLRNSKVKGVRWIRALRSGQEVEYTGLKTFDEVVALATALDEWEMLVARRHNVR